MSRRQTERNSTPMPTMKLDLGRFVTLRRRADGTHRVLFEVPPRLRPSDWSATIPLPVEGGRTGDLTNADELARIKRDAEKLYNQLQRVRRGQVAVPRGRTYADLVRAWQGSSRWAGLRPTSRVHYDAYVRNILAWAKSSGEPDPTRTTQTEIEEFLSFFNDKLTTKAHTLKTLRQIMDQAIALQWRTDNPCARIRIKVDTSRATIWEQADVDAYVAAAEKVGRKSIVLIVLLEWQIGQRVTDARGFRPGAEYVDGVFRFWQSKTQSYVTVPISPKLRDMLNAQAEGELFLFRDEATGKPYTAERLVKVFSDVRKHVVADGGRSLKLKWLRHSCVVQLARAGCTHVEIAAITGHAITSIGRILAVYLPRDNQVAWNAQEKRGLVNAKPTKVGRSKLTPVRR
jgi:hypothetical protein